jgi:hypothetical protein
MLAHSGCEAFDGARNSILDVHESAPRGLNPVIHDTLVTDNTNGHPYWQWCASISTDACTGC